MDDDAEKPEDGKHKLGWWDGLGCLSNCSFLALLVMAVPASAVIWLGSMAWPLT
jgi:hypothetical protein